MNSFDTTHATRFINKTVVHQLCVKMENKTKTGALNIPSE